MGKGGTTKVMLAQKWDTCQSVIEMHVISIGVVPSIYQVRDQKVEKSLTHKDVSISNLNTTSLLSCPPPWDNSVSHTHGLASTCSCIIHG